MPANIHSCIGAGRPVGTAERLVETAHVEQPDDLSDKAVGLRLLARARQFVEDDGAHSGQRELAGEHQSVRTGSGDDDVRHGRLPSCRGSGRPAATAAMPCAEQGGDRHGWIGCRVGVHRRVADRSQHGGATSRGYMSRAGSVPVRSAITSTHSSNRFPDHRVADLGSHQELSDLDEFAAARHPSLVAVHVAEARPRAASSIASVIDVHSGSSRGAACSTVDAAPHTLGLAIGQCLVLAGEVVVEGAQRHPGQVGDGFPRDVVRSRARTPTSARRR